MRHRFPATLGSFNKACLRSCQFHSAEASVYSNMCNRFTVYEVIHHIFDHDNDMEKSTHFSTFIHVHIPK